MMNPRGWVSLSTCRIAILLCPSTGLELRLHIRLVGQSGLPKQRMLWEKGLLSTSFVAISKDLKASVAQSAAPPHLSSQPLSLLFFFLLSHVPSMLEHSLTPIAV